MQTIPPTDDHPPSHPYSRLMTTYAAELRSIPGFERCRRTELAALARCSERLDLPAGYTLVQPGERWVGAIIVVQGEVIVETQDWTFLLTAGARIERTTTSPQDITVHARTDTRVLTIQRRGHILPSPLPLHGRTLRNAMTRTRPPR
jgi:hypothetical protein